MCHLLVCFYDIFLWFLIADVYNMAESCPEESNGEDNSALLDQYIDCAKKFIDLMKDLGHIKGASKLQRMCKSELKYLQTVGVHRILSNLN